MCLLLHRIILIDFALLISVLITFRRSPLSTLFPYTTLFRSIGVLQPVVVRPTATGYELIMGERRLRASLNVGNATIPAIVRVTRSEEHTSELQSRENLVCRLLLEKKNKIKIKKNMC